MVCHAWDARPAAVAAAAAGAAGATAAAAVPHGWYYTQLLRADLPLWPSLLPLPAAARRYDGQVFVKPPEVLARDRLLGTYEVKPVLARLR